MGIPSVDVQRILVVDDEPGACEMLSEFLAYHGYEVVVAGDGVEALEQLEKHEIHLVLTDVDMPRKKGTELLRELHALHPKLPVVLITGKPSIDTAVQSLRMGAVDYLTKPYDLNRLRSIIVAALPDRDDDAVNRTLLMEAPDRVIGGYTVVRTISEGAMGVIYEAERNNQRYALKLIRSTLEEEDQRREQLERFVREAEIASRVNHPNIVRIHDYGLADEELVPYIVMEYVDGLPLHIYGKRFDRKDYGRRAKLLASICDALACIHEQGICHRDIKPSNVMVMDGDVAKVTDFGVARAPGSELTMHDQILGSPLYMAPESFNTAHVDARADIFSFGVLAYEFLLGEVPFEGESISQVAARICESKPKNPRRHDRQFPLALIDILAKTLKKDAAERYANATAVAQDLRAFTVHEMNWQSRLKSFTQAVIFRDDWR